MTNIDIAMTLIPPHRVYIEYPLSSGSLILHKPFAKNNIGVSPKKRSIEFVSSQIKKRGLYFDGSLENLKLKEFVKNYEFWGGEFLYCNPESNISRADLRGLLACLKNLPCEVLLSYPANPFIDQELSEWNSRNIPGQGKFWFNYDFPGTKWLKSVGLAGKDYTDRQRIKRKAERWSKNFQSLQENERLVVLSALMSTMY